MSTAPNADVWSVLPATLKRAALVAVTTLFLAGALLYQENVGSERPSDIASGGAPGDLANPAPEEIVIATPTPAPQRDSGRSRATLTAPDPTTEEIVKGPPFPALGRYVFRVEGTETVSLFGSRTYPPEMTMTVHRAPADTSLQPDELVFDLEFSPEHREREIVAYRKDGIMFTAESRTVTYGTGTESSDVVYDVPITQAPIPLVVGAEAEGTTTATNTDDGTQAFVEDWTVDVTKRETIAIMGEDVDALVVEVNRQTQPGSSEQMTRSRRYWLDPVRAIWVQWEERATGRQDVGLGSRTYTSTYTATLDRVEPL